MRLLLLGFTLSSIGDFLYGVALVVFVAESTGSAAWVGAAAVARMLPIAVLSPVAGVLGDRLPARQLLIACDLGQAAAMLVMAALVAADSPPLPVLLVVCISAALSTPNFPVITALTPRLVAQEQLAATNTFLSTVEYLALVLGPAAGGLLLLVGPPSIPIALNSLTFLVSAAFTFGVRYRGAPGGVADDESQQGSFFDQLLVGLRATVSDRVVAVLVLFTSAVTFVYGFELVYLVFVSEELLGLGPEGVGYLNAAIGVGGALGALVTGRLVNSRRVRLVMVLTLIGCGVPLGLLAVVTNPWVAYALLAIEGLAGIALDVLVVTALQRAVPAAVIGRVTAILGSLTVLAVILGNILAVALLAVAGLRLSLVIAGAILPVMAVALSPSLRDLERRVESGRVDLQPAAQALTASRLLEGSGPTVVERLAGIATREEPTPGTLLIREGDRSDDLLVLASGRVVVTVGGRQINTVEAPGYVGEIGLLAGTSRTATVTTEGPCIVYRISGAEFVSVLTEAPPVALQSEMAIRLGRGTST